VHTALEHSCRTAERLRFPLSAGVARRGATRTTKETGGPAARWLTGMWFQTAGDLSLKLNDPRTPYFLVRTGSARREAVASLRGKIICYLWFSAGSTVRRAALALGRIKL
jgi:hypothetical protein